MSALKVNYQELLVITKNWGWFLAWGIVFIVLGIAAISAATIATFISVVFLGLLLFLGGVVVIVDSFTSWRQKWGGFLLHLIMGLLYLVAGLMVIYSPVLATVSLTLVLGVFFIVQGLFRIIYSLTIQLLNWGWNLFNGIITLFLGIIIMANWPEASLYIIGLFVGIDLLFCGWTYVMIALSARSFPGPKAG
ncbi:HdeD family acid-resistance protein [Aquicella lusitana]|uniref:Uncharacterized membrane protein HdeD (DUF308 family) n=1 Tax=Aquicella lusitana TaxID=254246 RepID=A0A370GJE2_9COXI|nr:DUF308 domain-containing protein [Aquicella lusitana]RDI43349.1 uncharacterized membrane protein HdeD (DUF308 family) [Aquicella lusitana]VVC73499.1 hypothetical protein AQULUS_12420 [Aquicella lusitana]